MTPTQQLAEIDKKVIEHARLLGQLNLWVQVQAQGIVLNTVKSFGFDEKLLTPKQRFDARRAALRGQPDPVTGVREKHDLHRLYPGERLPNGKYTCQVYNFIRHHDGTKTVLSPMLKAV